MRESSADILVVVHIAKEINRMNQKKILAFTVCMLLAATCLAQMGPRGKAELKAGDGSITIDYGQPQLKGRDMLTQLQVGSFWRMGKDTSTTFKTPVDLAFGSVKVPKGAYSLWLKRATPEQFELIFNSQTGQWGMQHDVSKDVYGAPFKKDTIKDSIEVFTIKLEPAANGGSLVLTWGTTQLKSDFQFAK
jgi:hypothetical protein